MNLHQRVRAFVLLGNYLRNLTATDLQTICDNAGNNNPWFTPASVRHALSSITGWLTEKALLQWTGLYTPPAGERRVAIIMAGNIPLVGFHDLLAVLISGHQAVIKLSSKDQFLPSWLIGNLTSIEPAFSARIHVVERLHEFDAVIATGSDNSARHFDYYFGKYPNIIRRNRTSVAVLSGNETPEQLHALGLDVFTYFGLGCRNVSKLFVPEGYVFNGLFESWEIFASTQHHHKYANNYDYQKSILLINLQPFLDNGFVLLQPSEKIVSPISVVYYETYGSTTQLASRLENQREKIQIVVGNDTTVSDVPFGAAQNPSLTDYADRVDIMTFLSNLS